MPTVIGSAVTLALCAEPTKGIVAEREMSDAGVTVSIEYPLSSVV
jgi:hypothetical protein